MDHQSGEQGQDQGEADKEWENGFVLLRSLGEVFSVASTNSSTMPPIVENLSKKSEGDSVVENSRDSRASKVAFTTLCELFVPRHLVSTSLNPATSRMGRTAPPAKQRR